MSGFTYHSAAVRFGKPGVLYAAALGTSLPALTTSTVPDPTVALPTGWVALGPTDAGSTINWNVNTDEVFIEEDLDSVATVTTGRTGSVDFALAETTYRNLSILFNGGVILDAAAGVAWTFEPPDMGSEVRIQLIWDANAVTASNDLRLVVRKAFNTASPAPQNRKGSQKAVWNASFKMEKPASGKHFTWVGSAALNPTAASYA